MQDWIMNKFGTDGMLIFAYGSLLLTVVTLRFLKKWTAKQDKTYIYKHDNRLDDVGLNAISSLIESSSVRSVNVPKELRPTWGSRLILPVIAIIMLATTDFSELWTSIGVVTEFGRKVISGGILVVFGYSSLMVAFVQKVTYDDTVIKVSGVDLTKKSRKLDGLVSIEKHPKRPILTLGFMHDKDLNVPSFLSKRAEFVQDMKQIIAKNAKVKAPQKSATQPFKFFRPARTVG